MTAAAPAPFVPGGTIQGRPNCFVRLLPSDKNGMCQAFFEYKGRVVAKLDESKSAEEIMIDAKKFAERMNFK